MANRGQGRNIEVQKFVDKSGKEGKVGNMMEITNNKASERKGKSRKGGTTRRKCLGKIMGTCRKTEAWSGRRKSGINER